MSGSDNHISHYKKSKKGTVPRKKRKKETVPRKKYKRKKETVPRKMYNGKITRAYREYLEAAKLRK